MMYNKHIDLYSILYYCNIVILIHSCVILIVVFIRRDDDDDDDAADDDSINDIISNNTGSLAARQIKSAKPERFSLLRENRMALIPPLLPRR